MNEHARPAPTRPARDPGSTGAGDGDGARTNVTDSIRTVAGLIAVAVGAAAVVIVAVVAISTGGETAGTIAGSAAAVIGSLVGAYLGVKIGTDQTAKALDQLDTAQKAHEETSKRAERYALHVDKDDAPKLR